MLQKSSRSETLISTAAGRKEPDLVLKNAKVLNVFTQEIVQADVAVSGDTIAGVGNYSASTEIDCTNLYLVPGLIDAHCHIESSMAVPAEFSRAVLPSGTTTLIADPHEIVNVCGIQGLQYMLVSAKSAVCDIFYMLPSCVPATEFETSGANVTANDMRPFLHHPNILGLAEVMNAPGVVSCVSSVLDKIKLFQNRNIDGHAPGLCGQDLQAYIASGISTDHEATTYTEAAEKARAGLSILVREGSAAHNLNAILQGVLHNKLSTRRFLFCTDDKHLDDIRANGHIIQNVRMAIQLGFSPVEAITMATYNTAEHYGLHDRGAIAAGRRADFLLVSNLHSMTVEAVYKNGKAAAELIAADISQSPLPHAILNSVHIKFITPDDLQLKVGAISDVIEMVPSQLLTNHLKEAVPAVDGYFAPTSVYSKLCVFERHGKNGNIAIAPLKGYGITGGAVATSVAHDSHNIIAAGDNDNDIALAVNHIHNVGGGYAIAQNGSITGSLPLRVTGLMSDEPFHVVENKISTILRQAESLHIAKDIEPFISLSFLALPVIPTLRLTDNGLIDLFVDETN